MHKAKLVPKLAIEGIRKNGSSYLPYILITSFSVFVFFIFNAIINNPMMANMPHAVYLQGLMMIGAILLAIILFPILISTYQFLIKQRKNELGLYNVLGLDRKYIGTMMLVEALILYGATVGLGILTANVFARFIFLILLNLTGLDLNCNFVADTQTYLITILYFGSIFLVNLIGNLWQVGKAKPIELMKSSKRGEKQEKGLVIKSLFGVCLLGLGYTIAITHTMNSNIFLHFFLAVFLVVMSTRLLFKAGTIIFLNRMKSIPKIYYQKHNFVTISGMLYRMKRNAQGLSNICIFSTMIMITLLCTISLGIGQDSAILFSYPMDVKYQLDGNTFTEREVLNKQIEDLAKKHQVEVKHPIQFDLQKLSVLKQGNSFVENLERDWYLENSCTIRLMALEDYNRLADENIDLNEDEVLVFCSTEDFGYDTVALNNQIYKVKQELDSLCFETKEPRNLFQEHYYIILSSKEQIDKWGEKMQEQEKKEYMVYFDLEGEKEKQESFIKALNTWVLNQEGGSDADYIGTWEKETRAMYGGLLFLGIFFGIVFSICLLLMMYYKQITEGYEDQRHFKILKQVGMSDREVKATIKKQILIVFFLPLVGAMMHTFVALNMVSGLLSTLYLFNTKLILLCSVGVVVVFVVLYIVSYILTSKAYYKIVK